MRSLVVALLLLLVACATTPTPAPHDPQPPAPALRVAVRGADGKPLAGPWKLVRFSMKEPMKAGEIGADGTFGAEVPAGVYLVLLGEGEVERGFWVYVDRPVGVALTLAKTPNDDAYGWSGVDTVAAGYREFDRKWQKEIERVVAAAPTVDGRPKLDERAKSELTARAEAARTEATAAHAFYRAAHLALFWQYEREDTRRADAIWITQNVAPDDPRLPLIMNLDFALGRSAPKAPEVDAWFDRIAATNKEPGFACDALAFVAWGADERHDEAQLRALYDRSQAPSCSGTHAASMLKKSFDPARPLQRGKPFPAFDFASVDASAPHVTKESRLGHPYLIEFWATWCSPCVKAMPRLHEVYPRVKAKHPNLEVVFVAVETSPEDLTTFRKTHPMPWTHAITSEPLGKLSDRFDFIGVPTLVLVDDKGAILEIGKKLYPDELEATLDRTLP